MKLIVTIFRVYIFLTVSILVTIHEVSAEPVSTCSTAGEQIGDTEDNTEYYICIPNGDGTWLYFNQTCPNDGVFLPDPTNPGCIDNPMPTTTEIVTTTAEIVTTTTEIVTTTTEIVTSTDGGGEESTTELPVSTTVQGETTESSEATSPEIIIITPTTAPPTTSPPVVYTCPSEGRFPDPAEPCTRFYQCLQINGIWYFYVYTCPAGTSYNATVKLCTAGECGPSTTSMAPSVTPTTAPPPTTTTAAPPPTTTTAAPPTTPSTLKCPSQGKFPVKENCISYYQCLLINSIWYSYTYNCPPTTHYDANKSLCIAGACLTTTTTTSTTTLPPSNSTQTSTSPGNSTTASPGRYVCLSQGKFQDPFNCAAYYQCILISGSWYTYKYDCPTGTHWDSSNNVCINGTC